jgi:hypothetical protein
MDKVQYYTTRMSMIYASHLLLLEPMRLRWVWHIARTMETINARRRLNGNILVKCDVENRILDERKHFSWWDVRFEVRNQM